MKSLGIYYRVSTGKQDFASQKSAIKTFLGDLPDSKRPQEIIEFKDHGQSGMDNEREAYQAIIKAAVDKRIDTVLVYRLDRLSRDASEAIQLLLKLDQLGVGFISVTQPVLNMGLDNPFRRTMLAAFAEIAELERETIVSRVNAGLDAARKRGAKLGRPSFLDRETFLTIEKMRTEGSSFGLIATCLGLSRTSVQRIFKEGRPPGSEK